MKKLMMVALAAGAAAVMTGCKSIEVDRRGQQLATDKNGEVVKTAAGEPLVLDMGWEVDYFQHWNWQKFDAMKAKAGEAELEINNYSSGADTNLTALVSASFSGGAQLATAIGDAYVKIAGGGAQADTVLNVTKKVISYFTSKGGDASKATVTTEDGKVKVTDGTTCVTCDKDGNCAACTDCTVTGEAVTGQDGERGFAKLT